MKITAIKHIKLIISISFIIAALAFANSMGERIPPAALMNYTEGLLAEIRGDFQAALDSYLIAELITPEEPDLLELIAELYMKLDSPQEALVRYKKLLELDPENTAYVIGAARASYYSSEYELAKGYYKWLKKHDKADFQLRLEYSTTLLHLEDLKSALNELEELTEEFPDQARPYGIMGEIYIFRGEYEKALPYFRKATELNPMLGRSYFGMATCFEKLGMPDSAMTAYKTYYLSDPKNKKVFHKLLSLQMERKDFRGAYSTAQTYLENYPEDWFVMRELAFLSYSLMKYDEATDYFIQILDIDPTDLEARIFYGRSLVESGNLSGGISQLYIAYEQEHTSEVITSLAYALSSADSNQRAIDILEEGETEFPWDPEIYFYHGIILAQMEKYKESIKYFRSALEIVPDYEDAIFAMGDAYERMGYRDSAIVIFEKLVKSNPDDPLILNYLGYILIDSDQRLDYAENLVAKALEFEPTNSAFLDSYGWLKYKLGEYKKALKYLLLAEENTMNDDPLIFDHIGSVYEKLENNKLAKKYYQKALEIDPEMEDTRDKLDQLK